MCVNTELIVLKPRQASLLEPVTYTARVDTQIGVFRGDRPSNLNIYIIARSIRVVIRRLKNH